MKSVSDKSYRKKLKKCIFSNFALRKSCHLWDNVEEYGRAGPATDDSLGQGDTYALHAR